MYLYHKQYDARIYTMQYRAPLIGKIEKNKSVNLSFVTWLNIHLISSCNMYPKSDQSNSQMLKY